MNTFFISILITVICAFIAWISNKIYNNLFIYVRSKCVSIKDFDINFLFDKKLNTYVLENIGKNEIYNLKIVINDSIQSDGFLKVDSLNLKMTIEEPSKIIHSKEKRKVIIKTVEKKLNNKIVEDDQYNIPLQMFQIKGFDVILIFSSQKQKDNFFTTFRCSNQETEHINKIKKNRKSIC